MPVSETASATASPSIAIPSPTESAPVSLAASEAEPEGISGRSQGLEEKTRNHTAGETFSHESANRSEGSGRKRNSRRRRRKGPRDQNGENRERENYSEGYAQGHDRDESDESFADLPEGEDENGTTEGENGEPRVFKTRKQRYLERREKERAREAELLESSPAVESEGIVEISPKGFGFLRERIRGFQQSPKDVFITPEVVRIFGLRDGHMVRCVSKQGLRGPQLTEILSINDRPPEECARLPYFEELTAINPNKKLTLETDPARLTTRVIDLVAPIGRGQRGLIVAPPRTGKTTFLHHIAEGLLKNYDEEIHLMVLLVDERPEEVTDFERTFPDVEVFSSSNDSEAKDHTRIALLAIERAKRLVESGRHVVMLMDSITRLARAFNSQMRGGGKRGTASGGLIVGALEVPRRIFAAARNTREAGSLTIIATALVQTNSKADEAIFQEFKGTG
ncbi:MAG: transcription termination factor Rho, partial [Verrucomicrobiae bacterium]|nr:transcription termination factor Rho [Verrucomicrobiae bacterium]